MVQVIPQTQSIGDVIDYWMQARADWFSHCPQFDRAFAKRFAAEYSAARRDDLQAWEATAEGCLALLILLDQYPRNAFRGTPQMYTTDLHARRIARHMVALDLIDQVPAEIQLFCLLPFSHSEEAQDQALAVQLHAQYLPSGLARARRHCDIISRFGRFPHRNVILHRPSRPEERRFLRHGGLQG